MSHTYRDLSDEELKKVHADVHEELKRRDESVVLRDLDAARPPPRVFRYTLRAFDVGSGKRVIWNSFKLSTEDAVGVGPFRDLTVVHETEVFVPVP